MTGARAQLRPYRVAMLKKVLKKIAIKSIDEQAEVAWKRGDAAFAYGLPRD